MRSERRCGPGRVRRRQYVEMLLQYLPSKTARSKPWKVRVAREALCADVVELFGAANARQKLFQRTEVTFVAHGEPEAGHDLGGLTAEMYSCFFREAHSRALPSRHTTA